MAVILMTSAVVSLFTSAAFVTYELITVRKQLLENVNAISQIIAANTTAALDYDVRQDAAETLASLAAEGNILEAAVYDKDARLFASFPTNRPPTLEQIPERSGSVFEARYLHYTAPIKQSGKSLGTLYLRYDLGPFYQRFALYAGIVVLVMASSFGLAYLVSNALQQRISKPILTLADTAREVSLRKDFSVRAEKFSDDELGLLTEAFNEMLGQIHDRDLALLESQERLRVALGAADMGTWRLDARNKMDTRDANLNRMLGFPAMESTHPYDEFLNRVHPDDQKRVQKAIQRALDQHQIYAADFRIIRPTGEVRWLRDRGKVIHDERQKPLYITGAAVDITELKKAEDQRARAEEEVRGLNADLEQRVTRRTAELAASNKELEAFTYSVSHDLRAPLRHLAAYTEILEEELGPIANPSAQQYLQRVRKAVETMGRLVDDLLNLARVSRADMVVQNIDLNAILNEVVAGLQPELAGREVEFKLGNLPRAECDPGQIRQVLTNLLSNAIKYTRPRPRALIEVGTTRTPAGELAVFVRDNGVGFNMKYVHKLFGVFQRLHRTEEFEGTGIGLATVQRIIQKHGGRIWADAEVDKGATFYFTLGGMSA
jgi:PAS domain S-box-containing protein